MKTKVIKTKNRHILTKIPAPGTNNLIKNLSKVESRSMHGQLPIAWDKAINYNIYDIAGNKFIDFTSTIFVTNIGHANPRLVKYLNLAISKKLIHSYAYINSIREKYIKKLIQFAGKGFEKAFLMSAGTEATEAALKLMRLHGQKIKKRKLGIICFEGNWHGRTLGSQMMSGNNKQKEWIGYKDRNIHHLPFPYKKKLNNTNPEDFLFNSLKKLEKKNNLKKDICGVMIETFQGWGAVYYPKKYIKALAKICKKNNKGFLEGISESKFLFMARQSLPKVYMPNGAIYIITVEAFKRYGTFLTKETVSYTMPKERSIDVDSASDMDLIRNFLNNQK